MELSAVEEPVVQATFAIYSFELGLNRNCCDKCSVLKVDNFKLSCNDISPSLPTIMFFFFVNQLTNWSAAKKKHGGE